MRTKIMLFSLIIVAVSLLAAAFATGNGRWLADGGSGMKASVVSARRQRAAFAVAEVDGALGDQARASARRGSSHSPRSARTPRKPVAGDQPIGFGKRIGSAEKQTRVR